MSKENFHYLKINTTGDIIEAGNITKISITQKTSVNADYPVATEYSASGWYRKWSDGTIEQVFDLPSGITYSGSDVNTLNKVVLPVKFSTNNYKVFLQSTSSSSFDKDDTTIYEVNEEYFVFDSTRYSAAFGFHVFCIGK